MLSRVAVVVSFAAAAASCFTLGVIHARRADAETSIELMRDELRRELAENLRAIGTAGKAAPDPDRDALDLATRARMVADIKRELQLEMGLLPVQLLRDRRSSFVELYATDNRGKTSYGTAGYLGRGYFVTVKHTVVALKDEDNRRGDRKIVSIKVVFEGQKIAAKLVDAGNAKVEVDGGDWAILKTRDLNLPALKVDTAFPYEFAEPIFRLGNDYSKGIVVSTGYSRTETSGGLVTCLTDGHPGVSGGGILDQQGDLVGIPIGRMQGDYRFSFILPMRTEMFRKVASFEASAPRAVSTRRRSPAVASTVAPGVGLPAPVVASAHAPDASPEDTNTEARR